jgi:hypothetical protein
VCQGNAHAQTFEGYAWGGVDAYSRGDEPGGHGIVFVGGRLSDLPRDAQLQFELNTDTLRVGFDNVRLNDSWWAGARLEGQFRFGNLLTDYHQNGEFIADRGFGASRFGGVAHLTARREKHLFIRFETGAQRWSFERLDPTSPALILPRTTTLLQPRLRVTWWDVAPDPSLWEWHRPFWRFEGLGFGLSFGVDHRDRTTSWGDTDTTRNQPARNSGVVTQWFRWGRAFGDWRFELQEEAGFMTGADDITRRQVGGMNPYVAPIAGAPWAAYLADRWATGSVRQRWAPIESMEVGLRVDAAFVDDIDRTGTSDPGFASGVALELDWRPADIWQVDAQVGYAFDTGVWTENPQLGFYVGAGRSF